MSKRTQWEYIVALFNGGIELQISPMHEWTYLSEWGAKGWEVVAVWPDYEKKLQIMLKRRSAKENA